MPTPRTSPTTKKSSSPGPITRRTPGVSTPRGPARSVPISRSPLGTVERAGDGAHRPERVEGCLRRDSPGYGGQDDVAESGVAVLAELGDDLCGGAPQQRSVLDEFGWYGGD